MIPVFRAAVGCAVAFCCAAAAAPVEIDSIAAVVNGDIVTRAELAAEADRVERGLRDRGARLPARAALEERALRSLIDRALQLQFAERNGVRVGEAQVDAALAELRADLDSGGDDGSFARRAREVFGVELPALRERVREDLRMQAAFYRGVLSRIEIDDADIERVAAALAAGERRYLLSHIFVSDAEIGAARARQAAARTRALAAAGGDFADLAARHSDGENAISGGEIGWRDSSTLPDLFLDAIRGLEAGEVSEVVESENGFHILQVRAIEDARAASAVPAARLRHILVADEGGRERLLALKKSLADEDGFAAAARRHSLDSQSAGQGGDLGWRAIDSLPPTLAALAARTAIGKIAGPAQTAFGWHLLFLTARETRNLGEENLKTRARAELRSRRAFLLRENWLRRLRASAFVKVLDGDA